MGNHYHLLLETPEANLVVGMKWLPGIYAGRFNRRHRVFGHLLAGRYKSVIANGADEAYFGTVSTYSHLNPVRSGLVREGEQRVREYRWSSYPAHGEAWAERWLVATEKALGWEARTWREGAKVTPEKQVLAWVLRTRTASSCRWVSERLGMGDESSVSRASGVVRERRERQLRRWKGVLSRLQAPAKQALAGR
jgi:hypothetical protein